jgi:signal peptidase I
MARSGVRRLRRLVFWLFLALAAAGLLGGSVTQWRAITHGFKTSSVTMENTIRPGDALFYVTASGLRRGDIVAERVPVPPGTPDLVVRRVIGLPGDHVSCCAAGGRVTVDGKPLDETYLYPGNVPSIIPFKVTLARGQYWLLGDRRSIAFDSRERGPVPQADVPWRVVAVLHDLSISSLRTPRTFVADGLAPVDTRPTIASGWIEVTSACGLVLLGYAIFGILRFIRFLARRRPRRKGAAPGPGQPKAVPSPR